MKVLVIGSSHVAALRLAAPVVEAARPDWRFRVFGAPASRPRWFRIGPGGALAVAPPKRLPPRRARAMAARIEAINGAEPVFPDEFDLVLSVGHAEHPDALARLLDRFDVEGAPSRARPGALSAAAFRAVARALHEARAPAADWAGRGFRRFAASAPRLSERLLARKGPLASAYRRLRAADAAIAPLVAIWEEEAARAHAAAGAHWLPQPPGTTAPGLTTPAAFSTGARRLVDLSAAQPETDVSHMNAEYGKELLEALIARVESARGLTRAAE